MAKQKMTVYIEIMYMHDLRKNPKFGIFNKGSLIKIDTSAITS